MAKDRKGFGSFVVGLTARSFMLIFAGVLILSYLSMYVNPAKAWYMTIFGLLFIPLVVINLILFLWAAGRGSKAAAIPLLALLPTLLLIGRYVQLGGPKDPDTEGSVKIVSYNLGQFSLYRKRSGVSSREECIDSVFAFLLRTDADIISLQEFRTSQAGGIKDYFSERMPGYQAEYYTNVDENGAYGNVILSRFPVLSKDKFTFDHSSNMAVYADLDINGRRIRVYNCHFESYNISIPGLAKSIAKKDDGSVQEAEDKMRASISKRPQQVDIVMADIRNSPVESIVTGDFNDTPLSYTYNRLKKGKKDSFVEAGKGMGGTYSELWPFIRIDYVLFPDDCQGLTHKVEKIKYSDHYPIVTRLKMN